MNELGTQLLQTADRQISELIDLISTREAAALRLPCPGREQLGDGTIAACALHTADNYHRIGGFLQGHGNGGHRHTASSPHGHHQDKHQDNYRAENIDLQAVLDRLSAGQSALSALAELINEQLSTVPPASDMKFCDGQRTLEQVIASLLNHQQHQLDALKAAIA